MARSRGDTVGSVAVFVGFGLVLATHVARSVTHPPNAVASVLLGSLPNFGAGLALPFVVTIWQQFIGRRPWLAGLRFCVVGAGAFAALALWEYVQLAAWRYPFDGKDIVASGVGVGLAILIATCLHRRRAADEFRPPECGRAPPPD